MKLALMNREGRPTLTLDGYPVHPSHSLTLRADDIARLVSEYARWGASVAADVQQAAADPPPAKKR